MRNRSMLKAGRDNGFILVLVILATAFYAWAQSEDELIRGAKKEGKVVFWSSMRIEDSRALAVGFEARFPFIKVDIFRAGRNGHALLADLLSVGEFPVTVVVYPDHIEMMKAKGQPVEWVKTTDPILVNLAPVGVAAKAPQPNAAKLLLNYSISREGQEILQKARRASARHDVPPVVPDMDPRKLKLVALDPDIPTNAEHIKDFRRVFALN